MRESRHTMNNLRDSLKHMTIEQKREKLQELHAALMVEWGREKSHVTGAADTRTGPHTCWLLRRCIAMTKTSLNMEGYHYQHRG